MTNKTENQNDGITVLALIAVIFAICVLIPLLSGCKTKYITTEVPVIMHERDSIVSVQHIHTHDTLMMRDSVYHYIKGDTVLIEKWHTLQAINKVVKVDTVYKEKEAEKPITIKEEIPIEVPAKLSWWQKLCILLGKLGLGIFGIWGIWKIIKWKKLI